MNLALILISIIVPTITAAAFGFTIYRWKAGKQLKSYLPTKHKTMFKFDLRTRKVFQMEIIDLPKSPFKDIPKDNWESINLILDKFDDSIQRLFRIAFDKMEKGSDVERIAFKAPSLNFKKHITIFTFTFYKGEEPFRYTMKVEWDSKKFEKPKKVLEKRLLTKDQVAESEAKWKGLVAFNVINGNEQHLLEIISKLRISRKELNFFRSAGYLIFYFPAKSFKNTKRKVSRFIKLFKKTAYQHGGSQMFEGSAWVPAPKANSVKLINNYVQTLDFLISVSIETRKDFVDKDVLDANQDAYKTFMEASKSFRQSVKTKDIDTQVMTVRNWKSKRKTVEYIYPKIEGINNKLIQRILRNKNNIEALIDAYADKMILESKVKDPSLIDVTPDWLIKHEEELKNRNIVYVVRIDDSYRDLTPLQEALLRLMSKDFVFALKIKEYTDNVTTLIQNVKPNFLVISRKVWNAEGLLDSDVLFKLMTTKKMADQLKIKTIYQEPSKIIDEQTADKIGLHFYFDITE